MDLEPSETARLLAESARALLGRLPGQADPAGAWQLLVGAGWTEISDPVLLGVALGELGRAALPSPYLQSAAAAAVLERHAPAAASLREEVAAGARVSLLAPPPGRAPRAVDGGRRLWGGPLPAEWAAGAGALLVVAEAEGGGGLFGVAPGDAVVEPVQAMDDEEVALVELQGAPARRLASWEGTEAARSIRALVGLLRGAEMAGGARRVLEMTVEHVRDRQQFGRPLAALQVVRHRCADAAIAVEAAELATREALWLLASGDGWRPAALVAAWVAGRAFVDVTVAASQLHGGLGYIRDHPLHRYFRHAKAQQLRLGPEPDQLRAVSEEPDGGRRWWASRAPGRAT